MKDLKEVPDIIEFPSQVIFVTETFLEQMFYNVYKINTSINDVSKLEVKCDYSQEEKIKRIKTEFLNNIRPGGQVIIQ